MRRGRPQTVSDEDLLDAAQAVLLEQGLDATTQEVARRAGISESVIFHRHGTKEALFLAVVERQAALAPELADLSALAGTGDLAEHLVAVARALVAKMRTVLPFFMLGYASPARLRTFHQRLRQVHPRYVEPLVTYFQLEIRAGRLRAVDPEALANTFFGSIREYVLMELMGEQRDSPPSVEDYLRSLIDVLLHGAVER